MTIGMQLAIGSVLLGVCSALHIGILAGTIALLQRMGQKFGVPRKTRHWASLTLIAFFAVVLAHTLQVWIWAASFTLIEVVPTFSQAIYFSLVTYTTLGYGDITAQEGTRIFAAMAAVTGLLNFGLSTAFLVGLLAKLLPRDIG